MSRIPRHVVARNRNASEADANAAFYSHAAPREYLLDLGNGLGAVSIELRVFLRANDFTPAERRQIRELQPGEAMNLGGGAAPLMTLHCIAPEVSNV